MEVDEFHKLITIWQDERSLEDIWFERKQHNMKLDQMERLMDHFLIKDKVLG